MSKLWKREGWWRVKSMWKMWRSGSRVERAEGRKSPNTFHSNTAWQPGQQVKNIAAKSTFVSWGHINPRCVELCAQGWASLHRRKKINLSSPSIFSLLVGFCACTLQCTAEVCTQVCVRGNIMMNSFPWMTDGVPPPSSITPTAPFSHLQTPTRSHKRLEGQQSHPSTPAVLCPSRSAGEHEGQR